MNVKGTSTYLHLSVFYKCRTMPNDVASKVDYGLWVITFKVENWHASKLDKDPKKAKVEKMYYLTEAQSKLLDVCDFKDLKMLLALKNVGEVNDFVSQYVQSKTEFQEKHGTLPCLGIKLTNLM